MARTKAARPATIWQEAEEVPRAGLPDAEKLARRQRLFRRVIWACIIAFPVSALALLVVAAQLKEANAVEPPAVVDVDVAGRAVAMTAVDRWLAGNPAPLPGGVLVSLDEMEELPAQVPDPSGTSGEQTPPTLQAHTLTVRDGAGMRYQVQVLVARNDAGDVAAVGTPSLNPVPSSPEWATSVSPWPNQKGTTAGESVEAAVAAWVEAFASGDPARLRLAVGDPDTDHAYQPMTGVVSADGDVTGAAWVTDKDGEPTSQMIVQVGVRFIWPGSDPQRPPAVATYDLLVDGADSAAPTVVAWGGSGTGPILRPYQNALRGWDLSAVTPPALGDRDASGTTAPGDVSGGAGDTGDQAGSGEGVNDAALPDSGEQAPEDRVVAP